LSQPDIKQKWFLLRRLVYSLIHNLPRMAGPSWKVRPRTSSSYSSCVEATRQTWFCRTSLAQTFLHPVHGNRRIRGFKQTCFFFMRILSAWFQKVGEIRTSHLLSPVLSFEIHAEPMLKPCAEGKNMANSTWKRPFHAENMSSNILRTHGFLLQLPEFRSYVSTYIVPEQSGDHGVPKSWYNPV
jgi:hypothetical protein